MQNGIRINLVIPVDGDNAFIAFIESECIGVVQLPYAGLAPCIQSQQTVGNAGGIHCHHTSEENLDPLAFADQRDYHTVAMLATLPKRDVE